ncbi:Lrp/AsnC family transcriptional regulator [Antarcticimicrobium sediminis]|uniref:Lrp/AsnC family transcriptional regulator n=1 Tax=Antarcticimicrobium sediminis TaxID=2546227 RepID=A0A4R5F1M9_9RHOB|nr:Lrp/AsnC family transcriptional regulator [Antarcticimicrobium sediminis]MDX2485765.1 Lrp/AsnC family transcriptional regulator [Pseudodonghicola sp.]TDE41037.1 Lrp/AsnC family transcriptional regulator [Antarcticimicrobium sediminis]
MLDDTDRRLLRHLQADPAQSVAELARASGVAASKAYKRLERLQAMGVLKGQRAVIDWRALGYVVEVSLRVSLDKTESRAFDEFIAAARAVPEVSEIQTFLGRVDVRLTVLARSMQHYQEVYRGRILTLPHIVDVEALMHVSTIKDVEALPL